MSITEGNIQSMVPLVTGIIDDAVHKDDATATLCEQLSVTTITGDYQMKNDGGYFFEGKLNQYPPDCLNSPSNRNWQISKSGCLPEIHRFWRTFDNELVLWDFLVPNALPQRVILVDEPIQAVCVARAKLYDESLYDWMLIVATNTKVTCHGVVMFGGASKMNGDGQPPLSDVNGGVSSAYELSISKYEHVASGEYTSNTNVTSAVGSKLPFVAAATPGGTKNNMDAQQQFSYQLHNICGSFGTSLEFDTIVDYTISTDDKLVTHIVAHHSSGRVFFANEDGEVSEFRFHTAVRGIISKHFVRTAERFAVASLLYKTANILSWQVLSRMTADPILDMVVDQDRGLLHCLQASSSIATFAIPPPSPETCLVLRDPEASLPDWRKIEPDPKKIWTLSKQEMENTFLKMLTRHSVYWPAYSHHSNENTSEGNSSMNNLAQQQQQKHNPSSVFAGAPLAAGTLLSSSPAPPSSRGPSLNLRKLLVVSPSDNISKGCAQLFLCAITAEGFRCYIGDTANSPNSVMRMEQHPARPFTLESLPNRVAVEFIRAPPSGGGLDVTLAAKCVGGAVVFHTPRYKQVNGCAASLLILEREDKNFSQDFDANVATTSALVTPYKEDVTSIDMFPSLLDGVDSPGLTPASPANSPNHADSSLDERVLFIQELTTGQSIAKSLISASMPLPSIPEISSTQPSRTANEGIMRLLEEVRTAGLNAVPHWSAESFSLEDCGKIGDVLDSFVEFERWRDTHHPSNQCRLPPMLAQTRQSLLARLETDRPFSLSANSRHAASVWLLAGAPPRGSAVSVVPMLSDRHEIPATRRPVSHLSCMSRHSLCPPRRFVIVTSRGIRYLTGVRQSDNLIEGIIDGHLPSVAVARLDLLDQSRSYNASRALLKVLAHTNTNGASLGSAVLPPPVAISPIVSRVLLWTARTLIPLWQARLFSFNRFEIASLRDSVASCRPTYRAVAGIRRRFPGEELVLKNLMTSSSGSTSSSEGSAVCMSAISAALSQSTGNDSHLSSGISLSILEERSQMPPPPFSNGPFNSTSEKTCAEVDCLSNPCLHVEVLSPSLNAASRAYILAHIDSILSVINEILGEGKITNSLLPTVDNTDSSAEGIVGLINAVVQGFPDDVASIPTLGAHQQFQSNNVYMGIGNQMQHQQQQSFSSLPSAAVHLAQSLLHHVVKSVPNATSARSVRLPPEILMVVRNAKYLLQALQMLLKRVKDTLCLMDILFGSFPSTPSVTSNKGGYAGAMQTQNQPETPTLMHSSLQPESSHLWGGIVGVPPSSAHRALSKDLYYDLLELTLTDVIEGKMAPYIKGLLSEGVLPSGSVLRDMCPSLFTAMDVHVQHAIGLAHKLSGIIRDTSSRFSDAERTIEDVDLKELQRLLEESEKKKLTASSPADLFQPQSEPSVASRLRSLASSGTGQDVTPLTAPSMRTSNDNLFALSDRIHGCLNDMSNSWLTLAADEDENIIAPILLYATELQIEDVCTTLMELRCVRSAITLAVKASSLYHAAATLSAAETGAGANPWASAFGGMTPGGSQHAGAPQSPSTLSVTERENLRNMLLSNNVSVSLLQRPPVDLLEKASAANQVVLTILTSLLQNLIDSANAGDNDPPPFCAGFWVKKPIPSCVKVVEKMKAAPSKKSSSDHFLMPARGLTQVALAVHFILQMTEAMDEIAVTVNKPLQKAIFKWTLAESENLLSCEKYSSSVLAGAVSPSPSPALQSVSSQVNRYLAYPCTSHGLFKVPQVVSRLLAGECELDPSNFSSSCWLELLLSSLQESCMPLLKVPQASLSSSLAAVSRTPLHPDSQKSQPFTSAPASESVKVGEAVLRTFRETIRIARYCLRTQRPALAKEVLILAARIEHAGVGGDLEILSKSILSPTGAQVLSHLVPLSVPALRFSGLNSRSLRSLTVQSLFKTKTEDPFAENEFQALIEELGGNLYGEAASLFTDNQSALLVAEQRAVDNFKKWMDAEQNAMSTNGNFVSSTFSGPANADAILHLRNDLSASNSLPDCHGILLAGQSLSSFLSADLSIYLPLHARVAALVLARHCAQPRSSLLVNAMSSLAMYEGVLSPLNYPTRVSGGISLANASNTLGDSASLHILDGIFGSGCNSTSIEKINEVLEMLGLQCACLQEIGETIDDMSLMTKLYVNRRYEIAHASSLLSKSSRTSPFVFEVLSDTQRLDHLANQLAPSQSLHVPSLTQGFGILCGGGVQGCLAPPGSPCLTWVSSPPASVEALTAALSQIDAMIFQALVLTEACLQGAVALSLGVRAPMDSLRVALSCRAPRSALAIFGACSGHQQAALEAQKHWSCLGRVVLSAFLLEGRVGKEISQTAANRERVIGDNGQGAAELGAVVNRMHPCLINVAAYLQSIGSDLGSSLGSSGFAAHHSQMHGEEMPRLVTAAVHDGELVQVFAATSSSVAGGTFGIPVWSWSQEALIAILGSIGFAHVTANGGLMSTSSVNREIMENCLETHALRALLGGMKNGKESAHCALKWVHDLAVSHFGFRHDRIQKMFLTLEEQL